MVQQKYVTSKEKDQAQSLWLSLNQPDSSYHAELFAIYLALRYFVESKVYEFSNIAYILSDCQAAITSSCSSNIHTSHQILIDNIRSSIHTLTLKGMKITFNWIAGHVNLQGNELADTAAKEAALRAQERPSDISATHNEIPLNTLKNAFKKQAVERWQRMWTLADTARRLHSWIPDVKKLLFPKAPNRCSEIKAIRLATGQTRLNANMYRMKLAESPSCPCSKDHQTVDHIFDNCKLLYNELSYLHNGLDFIYTTHCTPAHERDYGILNFIWPKHTNTRTRAEINKLLHEFVSKLDTDIFKI